MKVIAVYEENHGMIAMAKDYNAALRFLLAGNWINRGTDVIYSYIEEVLGENWKEVLFTWDIDTFNNIMCTLSLEEMEVYE